MGADPSEDLTAIRSSATVLPVERIDEGRLQALLAPDPDAERRVIEFFTAHIRNPHTLNAYARPAGGFAALGGAERHRPSAPGRAGPRRHLRRNLLS